MEMELQTINRLYLELSQVATATTAKELELQGDLKGIRNDLRNILATLGVPGDYASLRVEEQPVEATIAVLNRYQVALKEAEAALATAEVAWKISETARDCERIRADKAKFDLVDARKALILANDYRDGDQVDADDWKHMLAQVELAQQAEQAP